MAERHNVAISPEIEDRFWAKVDRRGDSDCWPWTGAINSSGYGSIGINRVIFAAQQISLIIAGFPRPIPPNDHALHSCDNRACVNPAHLRWGTHRENMDERTARRGKYQRRGQRGHAKLTEAQVSYVLASPKKGVELAVELGVHKATISDIRCGRTWGGAA